MASAGLFRDCGGGTFPLTPDLLKNGNGLGDWSRQNQAFSRSDISNRGEMAEMSAEA